MWWGQSHKIKKLQWGENYRWIKPSCILKENIFKNGDKYKYKQAGNQDNEGSKKYIKAWSRSKDQLINMFIRACQSHDCQNITEKVMDLIGLTMSQMSTAAVSKLKTYMYGHRSTHICCRGGGVMWGFTYYCVAITGHWNQEVNFHSSKDCKK